MIHEQVQLKTLSDSFRDTTVNLIAGEAQKKISVHKFLVCRTAPYFQAALNGSFKEAAEQTITMPEQSPETIERFVLWVYTGKLLEGNEEAGDLTPMRLADIYIVGDIYGIPELQNSAMDCLVAWVIANWKFPAGILTRVYEHTPKDCRLQRFIVERAATKYKFHEKGKWLENNISLFPQQYLMDIVRELSRHRWGITDDIDWNNLGCRYHVHPEDVVKPAKGHSDTSRE